MHVSLDAPDHFIGISLLTPPRDSAGTPHILEHCVLNGSKSYPVSDAFNELWRGSLHTHLNAVTYPDRTVYFAGSTHEGEFLNLSRVYLDLVFNPLLDRRRMLLESYHLRPERRGRSLLGRPSGVIYSEMRGSYSDPGELSYLKIQSELLPDTPYRNDSGGDPSEMGSSTWEEIREYHRAYYRPSNARIFICSPMDTGDLASLIHRALPHDPAPRPAPPAIPLQPRWRRPRKAVLVTPKEPGGASIDFSWLLGESGDSEQAALAQILEEVLLSDAGCLYRALMDSRLGTDLSYESGLEVELREMIFTVGLRGTSAGRADAVRRTILDELSRFISDGPAEDVLDAAVNSLMFAYLDRVEDFPLALFTRAMRAWSYGLPPDGWLDHASTIGRLAAGGDLTGKLKAAASTWLRDNPHRLQLLVEPVARRVRGERMVRLDRARHEIISTEARELEEFSAMEDTPEALRSIPRLDPGELPMSESGDRPVLRRSNDTDVLLLDGRGGTAWLEMAFAVPDLSRSEDLHLPLALSCLTGMGAGRFDHREMSIRLGRDTGGIDPRPAACEEAATGRPAHVVSILVGFFPERPAEALALLRTALLSTRFGDLDRLAEIVEEQRGNDLSDLIASADWYARVSAASRLSESFARRNGWEGLPQAGFIAGRKIETRSLSRLSGRLEALVRRIFTRERLISVACFPGTQPERALDALSAFMDDLPAGGRDWSAHSAESRRTGAGAVMMPLRSEVATVCTVVPAPRLGSSDAALFTVGTAAFSDGPIYRKLRMSGGAYEVSAWHDPMTGLAFFASNRDPDPARTRAFFASSPDLLRASPPSGEDVRLAVLSTFAGLEQPAGPRVRCGMALARHLARVTPADMEAFRADLAGLDAGLAAERYPDLLEKALESASVFVLAPEGVSVESVFGSGTDAIVLPAWR